MKEIRVEEKADGNLEVTIIKNGGVSIKFTDVIVTPYGEDAVTWKDKMKTCKGGE